jgi:predicted class III extradiol MEMO1 family dioxygenase
MIPKSGYRFSEKDHAPTMSVIPKSGYRFSEKDHAPTMSMIPKSGYRFSGEIMRLVDLSTGHSARILGLERRNGT